MKLARWAQCPRKRVQQLKKRKKSCFLDFEKNFKNVKKRTYSFRGHLVTPDYYSLDFTGARDSEWQWHQLGYMQVCTSLQTDNHASTPPLCFLQTGCPSCRPTNSVKALKALTPDYNTQLPKVSIGKSPTSDTFAQKFGRSVHIHKKICNLACV